jgi:NAD(P)-dependent dehydrogenase (short-subunit alcohol dehydrogenase family)
VSSIAARHGAAGATIYAACKGALDTFTRGLAKELAPRRIRVNTINPGPIDNSFQLNVEDKLGKIIHRDATQFFNDIIPLGRHGKPEEIAEAVLFLASDMSSFTTGSMLMADGGMSA